MSFAHAATAGAIKTAIVRRRARSSAVVFLHASLDSDTVGGLVEIHPHRTARAVKRFMRSRSCPPQLLPRSSVAAGRATLATALRAATLASATAALAAAPAAASGVAGARSFGATAASAVDVAQLVCAKIAHMLFLSCFFRDAAHAAPTLCRITVLAPQFRSPVPAELPMCRSGTGGTHRRRSLPAT